MKYSACLSLAMLSTALLLSLPASAHDPKEFDRMLDAAPSSVEASACAKLDALSHSKTRTADAEVKSLRARCEAEKKTKSKTPVSSKAPGRS